MLPLVVGLNGADQQAKTAKPHVKMAKRHHHKKQRM
jgi:hypothetical protein